MSHYNSRCKICGDYSFGYELCKDCYYSNKFEKENENNWNTEKIEQTEDFRKTYLPEFRTNDGHYVRSQGELLIDNWLYDNNILHEYEKRISINNTEYYADFYIKEKQLYIEYFGLIEDAEYEKKCNNKIKLYNKNKIDCIYIYPKDIQHIQDILEDYIINNKIQILDDDDFF